MQSPCHWWDFNGISFYDGPCWLQISSEFFDKLDHIARYVRGNQQPFGGIQMILSGDFFQLAPVGVHPLTAVIWLVFAETSSLSPVWRVRSFDESWWLLQVFEFVGCSSRTADVPSNIPSETGALIPEFGMGTSQFSHRGAHKGTRSHNPSDCRYTVNAMENLARRWIWLGEE
jgi:hypothetical protein